MAYLLLGKIFICLIVFVVVWAATVTIASLSDGSSGTDKAGSVALAVWILGPMLGIAVAVFIWFFVLPSS